jgi:hypothetical protein
MPDFIDNRAIAGAPVGWGEAFAALPQEAPPGDGWGRVASRLDARAAPPGAVRRERRTNWAIGLASAAVLVVAAWSPLSQWLHSDGTQGPGTVVATAAPGSRGPAAPARAAPQDPTRVADQTSLAAPEARMQTPAAVEARSHPEHKLRPKRARVAAATRRTPAPMKVLPEVASASPAPAPGDALQKLKSQSAQLEALVALARDDQVGNASNELLSSELDAGIAAVDAALSQQDLLDDRKHELWQQRVDLLRQLAGVEATARWLAAQGASSETLLVSVD